MSKVGNSLVVSIASSNRVPISNARMCRSLDFTGWSKVRLGMLFCLEDSGANIVETPRFALGLSSGITQPFNGSVASNTVTNWCGAISNNATWTRSTAPVRWSSGAANSLVCAKKVGTTLTTGSGLNNAAAQIFSGVTSTRIHFIVDITKGSPNYTFQAFYLASTSPSDNTVTDFISRMNEASPSQSGYNFGTAQTLAVDESAGTFDSFNFSWSRTFPDVYISAVGFRRLS